MYWNLTDRERFFKAFDLADNPELLRNFISDIMTEKEIQQCVTRLKAACMIYDGASYSQIHLVTKLAPSTIARLSKRFKSKECGFSQIIEKFASKGPAYFD